MNVSEENRTPVRFSSCAYPEDSRECPICHDPFKNPMSHPDGPTHVYCSPCLDQWLKLKPTCPECRAPIDMSPISWKEKTVSYVKMAAKGAALTAGVSVAARVIATESGATAAVDVLKSPWIQSAALCAALCMQINVGSGRLYRLKNALAAAAFYIGVDGGAAIGAATHAPQPVQAIAPWLGGGTAIATTLMASISSDSPASTSLSLGTLMTTGMAAYSLATGAGLKETSLGAVAGASTGAAAVALAAVALPVVMATGRYLVYRWRDS